ncbi:MAG: dihydroorotase [Chloroflexi bacterium]|nr:dihydroorotase [Chloroflexota bacterium]
MKGSLLIRGGRVIDPASRLDAKADLYIKDGRIEAVQQGGGLAVPEGTASFDASGLVVSPGFVDLHAHLREPGQEHKETIATGTRAAAKGGFTTVCAMPNTVPAQDSRSTIEFVQSRAADTGAVRVLVVSAVSKGRAGKELVEMAELAKLGVVGYSDDGSPVGDAQMMRHALAFSRMLGLPIMDHCEDTALCHGGVMNEGRVATRLGLRGMPVAGEETMVARNLILSKLTGGHVHICHLSAAGSVEQVRRAKAQGIRVTAEATPHHLTLTDELVTAGAMYDTNTKVNPPLRTAADVEAVLQGLREGVIEAIATDHAPHAAEDKLCEYDQAAFGISGFETAMGSLLSLVHTGKLTFPVLIERLTLGPARIIAREKDGIGALRPGAPGDVAVTDPDLSWTVDAKAFLSKGKNSPLNGKTLKGKVVATVYGGALIYQEQRQATTRGR